MQLSPKDDRLYLEEILELTERFRFDEDWYILRNILDQKGFDISTTLLVSFIEDEEEQEYGIFITSNQKIYKYARSTADGKNNAEYIKLTEISSSETELSEYPQIKVGLDQMN